MQAMLPFVVMTCAWLLLTRHGVISLTNSTKFVRDTSFDGLTCAQNDTVLVMTDVTKITCAKECNIHTDCRSMFFLPMSGWCAGCTRIYKVGDLLGVFAGSQYFYDESAKTQSQQNISQWAQTVTGFSSEFYLESWMANEALGPPNVYPSYGDIPGAWSPYVIDSNQYLQVQFAEAVYITGVEIYETYHAGGVKAIKGLNGLGNWTTLWSTNNVQVLSFARVFAPVLNFAMTSPSRDIRIEVDCTASNGYVEIDAVKLVGTI